MTRGDRPPPAGPLTRIRRRRSLPRLPTDPRGRRSLLVLSVLGLGLLLVAGQLVRIQVLEGERYAAVGAEQRDRTVTLPARRGRIYDREGAVLATSVDAATVYADPRAFRPGGDADGDGRPDRPAAADPDEVAGRLAPLLGQDAATIREKLTQDAHFVYLARQVDWGTGRRIEQLDLSGVGVLTTSTREDPAGSLAGHVLGFTGIDGAGLEGLEASWDETLAGRAGQLQVERAPGGLSISSGVRELVPARPGTDLVLSLDREIQATAQEVAGRVRREHDAAGAGVVVLDVDTGDVLAMANAPGYSPDDVDDTSAAQRRNRAVTDMFEPGSVQKAVTAAAAIEAGVVSPDTTLSVPDRLRVGDKTFTDSHSHPTETMSFAEIIEVSSNVGTIKVAQRLGAERLHAALREFGYGAETDLRFPGEASGLLAPADRWWATSLPTIAIGQGVAVTLLQAASAYATIADDGVAASPRLVRGTVGGNGRLDPAPASDQRRVVSARTARQVQDMLAGVVSGEEGTGARAAVPGYTVAGKTGTARKPRDDGRGYSDSYMASFVGFAPAGDPELAVAVMVDQPTPIWGGVVAAPAFSEVMGFALTHREVPPTGPTTASAAARPAGGG